MARRYCKDPDDAADLVSETIYKCLRYEDQYDRTKDFRSWSLKIMQNTYITQYHRQMKVPFVGYEDCINSRRDDYCDQRLAVRIIMEIVGECAKQSLGIECVMLYAQGYSYDEISRTVGICTGTVKSRIRDGRRILKEALMM